MIRPDVSKWGQTTDDVRRLATASPHVRTRERFLALFMIASGQSNATLWAARIGRCDECVLSWVHTYNACGPDAMTYRRTGGHAPCFAPEVVDRIVGTVRQTEPTAHGIPGHGWTLKKLRRWVGETLHRVVSRAALHAMLRAAGLSWKTCKKLLGKRNPHKRAAFMERLVGLYERVVRREVVLIYVDESHFHRDLDLGWSWGRVGERLWRVSGCAPLSDRINWFGAYNFTDGECRIWADGACNTETTVAFLHRIGDWVRSCGREVVVIWDGAPWHRAKIVPQTAKELGITVVALPGYSPDRNPIAGLWKWMRDEVTQHHCHDTVRELFDACKTFIDEINQDPLAIVRRLWPRFTLDPEVEKLGFST